MSDSRTTCKLEECGRPLDTVNCDHPSCAGYRAQGFCSKSHRDWYYELKDVLLHKVNYQ